MFGLRPAWQMAVIHYHRQNHRAIAVPRLWCAGLDGNGADLPFAPAPPRTLGRLRHLHFASAWEWSIVFVSLRDGAAGRRQYVVHRRPAGLLRAGIATLMPKTTAFVNIFPTKVPSRLPLLVKI
jgi:hypothetical protein